MDPGRESREQASSSNQTRLGGHVYLVKIVKIGARKLHLKVKSTKLVIIAIQGGLN